MGFAEPAGTIVKGGPADLVLLAANPLISLRSGGRKG